MTAESAANGPEVQAAYDAELLRGALTDAETALVLDMCSTDERSAELFPMIRGLITSLAPMFGMDESDTAGIPPGLGPTLDAVADARDIVRSRRTVHEYHAQRGDSWRPADG